MKVEKILEHTDKLYEHLMEAYEIAGDLRDTFSGVETNEGKLKEYCNTIRGKIYELRELRGQFKTTIKTLEQ